MEVELAVLHLVAVHELLVRQDVAMRVQIPFAGPVVPEV